MDQPNKINLLKEFIKFILIIHLVFLSLILIFCLLFIFVNPPASTLQLYRKWVFKYDVKPVKYVPLRRIPREIRTMVVDVEDGAFYKHIGVDFDAIKEAIALNQRLHRKFYGGSTITQQLARTLFLIPEKTFFRKYLEALIALEMDLVMKKDRILELYLNSIEWGRGVFGIGQASLTYYGKNVSQLNSEEMIRLITILPSPVKYGPDNFNQLRIMNQRYYYLKSLMGLHPALSDTDFSNQLILSNTVETNSGLFEKILSDTNHGEEDPKTNHDIFY